jgi:hypothetical protein
VYTYTAGTLVGGLVEEYKLTRRKDLLGLAHNVAKAVITFLTNK